MAEDGRLRGPRRAAGEQERSGVVGVGRFGGRFGHGRIGHPLEHDGPGHGVDPRDGTQPFGHAFAGHDDGRGAAADDGPELVVGQPVVDRDEGHSGERGPEEHHRHGFGVEIDQAGPGARCRLQDRCPPPGPGGQLGDGHPVVARADGHPVAHAVHGHLEQHRQVHGLTLEGASGPDERRP